MCPAGGAAGRVDAWWMDRLVYGSEPDEPAPGPKLRRELDAAAAALEARATDGEPTGPSPSDALPVPQRRPPAPSGRAVR